MTANKRLENPETHARKRIVNVIKLFQAAELERGACIVNESKFLQKIH